jgi:regulator of protease activity HflC (stomatin/prohibitin superfamily)
MPGLMITAIIFTIIFWLAVLCARIAKGPASKGDKDSSDFRAVMQAVAVVMAVATVITLFFASFNPVGTREIGIVTSYGKPVGHLNTGPNFTWPWDQVTAMDEAVQLTDYLGANAVPVTIAEHQTAQAPIQLRWKINPANADDVFGNFKNSTNGVLNGLIDPELASAVNTVFENYDPVATLNALDPVGSKDNPSIFQLASQIQALLEAKTSGDITIVSLIVRPLVYNSTVANRINAVATQKADTLIATQAEQTALAQAQANKDLQASVIGNPLVLVQNCFTYLGNLAKDGLTPPAGFSCWPGQSSGIVIPSATQPK